MNRSRLLPTLAGLLLCAGAVAQQPAVQPVPEARGEAALTPEQRQALARQDEDMSQAALLVMQMVDGNRIGEVWDGASEAMKRIVPRDEFIRQVTIDRNRGSVWSAAVAAWFCVKSRDQSSTYRAIRPAPPSTNTNNVITAIHMGRSFRLG